MDYELEISNLELDHVLSFSHSNILKGSDWFKAIEEKMVLSEDEIKNLHGSFRVSKEIKECIKKLARAFLNRLNS